MSAAGWTGEVLGVLLGAWVLTGPVVLAVIAVLVARNWWRARGHTEAEQRAHRLREQAETEAEGPGENVTLTQAWREHRAARRRRRRNRR